MSSPAPFDHVILTRFSVRMFPDTVFTDDWLAYRWGLFRDALMASLGRQSVDTFTWLVFFDAQSPDWLRDLVAETGTGRFTPIWHDGPWVHEPIRSAVDAVTSRPYLITTRIDSDDAVSRYFVEDVQSRFAEQESQYVNLMHGVQIDRSTQLFGAHFAENGFISYIEKRIPDEPPRTVFWCMAHEESSNFAPVLNVVGPPRWMQVIHGSNVANSVRGLRARPEPFALDFDVDLPFDSQVPVPRFVAEWTASLARLLALWARHPTFALVYGRAQLLRLKGTTTVPLHTHTERRSITALRELWRRLRR
jgi:hypothetical protein